MLRGQFAYFVCFIAISFCNSFLCSQAINVAKPQTHKKQHNASLNRHEVRKHTDTEPCSFGGETRRVAFFHIPKTGTSLGTLIAHYTNPSLPESAAIPNCQTEVCTHVSQACLGQLEFQFRYPTQKWFKDCLWLKPGHGPDGTDWMSHSPITDDAYRSFEGRFVGFFRDPKQRALSSFYSFEHTRLETYGIRNEEKWARLIEGTAVKMLAGQQFPIEAGATVEDGTITVPNLELAMARLDGFMLTGLVEHYELSVCLFHAITGSKWGSHDTENMRQRRSRESEKWDEKGLKGYVDPYDTPIYGEVKRRFWRAIHERGLTRAKCHSLCPVIEEGEFL